VVKILKFFDSDPGYAMEKKFGSGINIPDPQHCTPEADLCCRLRPWRTRVTRRSPSAAPRPLKRPAQQRLSSQPPSWRRPSPGSLWTSPRRPLMVSIVRMRIFECHLRCCESGSVIFNYGSGTRFSESFYLNLCRG